MAGAPASAPAAAVGTAVPQPGAAGTEVDLGPEPQTCPHCGALNVADALFCEACGYDFTTGTPPTGSGPPTEEEPETAQDSEEVGQVEAPDVVGQTEPADEPDEPRDEPEPADTPDQDLPAPDEEPDPRAGAVADEDPQPEAEPGPDVEPALPPQPVPQEDRTSPPQHRARHTPPSRELAQAWVVELWVDPDWYAVQQTAEDIPSPGVPDTVLLTRSNALIGRPSGSLGARPDVDAGVDSAVSRRHAQLTSDGRRWWIEDLGSSNGTFVGTVGEPLPSAPLTPGQRVELDRDDRVYLGAWTRLVLRPATGSEQHGTG
ncbi:FHA domain-containing protein [Ornithinimicrobium avium]|nr:FHA domain-containing protein [Ornithinimicrobium avium]